MGHGGVLGIPRDSWVRIAGGGMSKINASLSTGGPAVMLQTVADVTGLNLDGYVLTGFTGFQEMVGNVLGGVDIDLPLPVADSSAGADLDAGPQYLNGPDALALARARKSLAGGDLTRQFNGGLLLLAALSSAQAYGPLHLPTLISESAQWMITDLTAGRAAGLLGAGSRHSGRRHRQPGGAGPGRHSRQRLGRLPHRLGSGVLRSTWPTEA